MKTYFEKNQWEAFVCQRLNELIDTYRKSVDTPLQERNYVVFDFDETSILGDVEDNLMIYMMEELLYKLTPAEFEGILKTEDYNLHQEFPREGGTITPHNLATDIIEAYTYLWNHYIKLPWSERPDLEYLKQKQHYQSFRAKLRYYYRLINQHYRPEAGKVWPTYWFAGYTQEEIIELSRDMLTYMSHHRVYTHHYYTDKSLTGLTGEIYSFFITGLAFSPELVTLFQALADNQITAYVVSASPVDVVKTAACDYHLQIPRNQVYGMSYQYQSGKISPVLDSKAYVSHGPGKSQIIRERIAPQHGGRHPVAIFGDSQGDWDMMKDFDQVDLVVLFNLLRSGQIQELAEQAIMQHGQKGASVVMQGRNNNKLTLIDHYGTIPFGKKNLQIYAN